MTQDEDDTQFQHDEATEPMRIPIKFVPFLLLVLLIAAVSFGSRWFGGGSRQLRDRATGDRARRVQDGEYENAFFQGLADKLAEADDLDSNEHDSAVGILREADPLWSDIKEQNRIAIQRANLAPIIVPPTPPSIAPLPTYEVLPADAN